jgi:hypothetical protein
MQAIHAAAVRVVSELFGQVMLKWPIFWSDLNWVSFSSVLKAAYGLVTSIVGPPFDEIELWPRPSKDVPLEGGQIHCWWPSLYSYILALIERVAIGR